jgi:hypothetical protein
MITTADVAINILALLGAVCFAAHQRDFRWRFSVGQLLILTSALSLLLALLVNS